MTHGASLDSNQDSERSARKHRNKEWRALLPSARDYADLRFTWRQDLTAGITVGIVALPLALAFGVSSGVGAEAGLITAIVAGRGMYKGGVWMVLGLASLWGLNVVTVAVRCY